ncbi:hypothetical protein B7494_g3591 [Chlorociboria aeruginascens]|nr:hypothetical protein B7494_g3591 [Chlorociboria aeruginascens]
MRPQYGLASIWPLGSLKPDHILSYRLSRHLRNHRQYILLEQSKDLEYPLIWIIKHLQSSIREVVAGILRSFLTELFEIRYMKEAYQPPNQTRRMFYGTTDRLRSIFEIGWFFEWPGGQRPLNSTWPWTGVRPSLLVIWGVCWMFVMAHPRLGYWEESPQPGPLPSAQRTPNPNFSAGQPPRPGRSPNSYRSPAINTDIKMEPDSELGFANSQGQVYRGAALNIANAPIPAYRSMNVPPVATQYSTTYERQLQATAPSGTRRRLNTMAPFYNGGYADPYVSDASIQPSYGDVSHGPAPLPPNSNLTSIPSSGTPTRSFLTPSEGYDDTGSNPYQQYHTFDSYNPYQDNVSQEFHQPNNTANMSSNMSLSYDSRAFMPTDANYPQMAHEEQEFKHSQPHQYPSPPPPLSQNPYHNQVMAAEAEEALQMPELPKEDDNNAPSPGRSKPVPKPEREIVKDATGRFICNFEGCTEEIRNFGRKCDKHMDKHERPYRCHVAGCEKLPGFTYSGGLLRHEREVHNKHGGPRKQLNCPHHTCKRHHGKGFSRQENLNEHLRRVHTDNGLLPLPEDTEDDVSDSKTGQKRKRGAGGDGEIRDELKRLRAENEELRRQSGIQTAQQADMMRQIQELRAVSMHRAQQAPQANML